MGGFGISERPTSVKVAIFWHVRRDITKRPSELENRFAPEELMNGKKNGKISREIGKVMKIG